MVDLSGIDLSPTWVPSRFDETDFKAVFDQMMVGQPFRNIPEVRGHYLTPKSSRDEPSPRIDRILVPHREAVERGWNMGIIGVELKGDSKSEGRVISQCLDYRNAIFCLPDHPVEGMETEVRLSWVLFQWHRKLWPSEALQSIIARQRLGCLRVDPEQSILTFHCDGTNAMQISQDGEFIRSIKAHAGLKRGSQ